MSIFIWLELPHRVVARGSHTATSGHHSPHLVKSAHMSAMALFLPPTPHKNPLPMHHYPPEVKALASDRAVVKELLELKAVMRRQ